MMLTDIVESSKIELLREAIESSENVVLTCHKSPDGDAVGSTMGLREVLRRTGKKATVHTPNLAAPNLLFQPYAAEPIA